MSNLLDIRFLSHAEALKREAKAALAADIANRKASFLEECARLERLEVELKACIRKSGLEDVLACFVNATEGVEGGEAVNDLYRRLYK